MTVVTPVETAPLYKVATIERGVVAAAQIQRGTLYVGLEHMDSDGHFVDVQTVDPGDLASSKFAFSSDHVLYGKLRPYLAKIARPNFSGVCSTDILPILPGKNLDRDFLCHFLRQPRMVELATSRATGANLPRLSPKALSEFEIPLPSLPEQRRIAAVLDKADELRAKRRSALEQLSVLTQAMFVDMFGDPATNPKGWQVVRLDQVAVQVTDGEHITPKRTAHGIKLLSARNVRDGVLDFHDVDFVGEEEYARISKRCKPERGDVLISCSGTIGRVATVETDEPLALVRSAALVKLNRTLASPKYFEYYLRTPYMRFRMLNRANASSQANLFQGQIRELPVLLPDRALQDCFSDRLGKSTVVKEKQEKSVVLLDTLFASLQHQAFSGEL